MTQTDENAAHSTLQRHSSASFEVRHPAKTRDLSDREAVIAVMVANGLTCEDIAVRLSLPLRTVEIHLQEALSILNLMDVEDLTYVIVAAHYKRSSLTIAIHPGQFAAADRQAPEAFHHE